MTRWKREESRRKRKAAKAARAQKEQLRIAVKSITKVLTGLKETHRWQEDRKNIVRKALDVLAGEAAS